MRLRCRLYSSHTPDCCFIINVFCRRIVPWPRLLRCRLRFIYLVFITTIIIIIFIFLWIRYARVVPNEHKRNPGKRSAEEIYRVVHLCATLLLLLLPYCSRKSCPCMYLCNCKKYKRTRVKQRDEDSMTILRDRVDYNNNNVCSIPSSSSGSSGYR